MLDVVSNDELRLLSAVDSPNCVSFYLPTYAAGSGTSKGPIRLRNLMGAARKELERRGMSTSDATQLLSPVDELANDSRFWAHTEAGLAVFVQLGSIACFRLPGPVTEALLVADNFWIAPLVPFVGAGRRFHILALSQNRVRLFEANRYRVTELDLGEASTSLAEALRFDERESQLQSHSAHRVGSGRVVAAFHGHDASDDYEEVDMVRFLRTVDHGIVEAIGEASDPLVLAGVEEIITRFRKISTHPNIVDSTIRGNPDRLSPWELHAKALTSMESVNADGREARELLQSPPVMMAESVLDVVDAARGGRIAQLIVAGRSVVWGSIDSVDRHVEVHLDRQPDDCDIVDLTMRETLEHGGEVLIADRFDMPDASSLAAVLRY